MSLIVAKKYKEKFFNSNMISIVSDTRLTESSLYGGMPLPWKKGVIKTSILDPNLAISWAGRIDYADSCLKNFTSKNLASKEEVIEFFDNAHSNSLDKDNEPLNQGIDFILAFGGEEIEIVEIKNQTISRNCTTSWIGSHPAFNLFQHSINKPYPPQFPISKKMEKAMQYVVESEEAPEVGDFVIGVIYSSNNKEFIFTPSFESINYSQKLHKGTNQIGIGSTASGSFSVSRNICQKNRNVLAFYFNQGKFGLLFKSDQGGILKLHEEKAQTADEFTKVISEKYGLDIPVCFK